MLKVSDQERQVIKEFCLFNDQYMSCFFNNFKEGAEFLVQMILDAPDLKVDQAEIQKSLPDPVSKSFRMDVVARDQEGKVYDIEFQTAVKPSLFQRSRVYSSVLDRDMLAAGQEYEKLAESYVIFLCAQDAVGLNLPMHHFTMKDEHGNELKDGRHIIFINASYPKDWRLKKLMEDLLQSDPEKMHYPLLKERAKYFKETEEGSMYVNTALQSLISEREARVRAQVAAEYDGRLKEADAKVLEADAKVQEADARAKEAEARAQKEKVEMVRELLKGNLSVDLISHAAKMSREQVLEIQKDLQQN